MATNDRHCETSPRKDRTQGTQTAQSRFLLSAFSAGSAFDFLYADRFEVVAALLLDVFMQRVAVRVHRHNRRKVFHAEMPHRFGRAEFEQRDAVDAFDRAGVEL